MAKSRGAVRNKTRSKQFKFDFKMPSKTKSLTRVFSLLMLFAGLVYLGVIGHNNWQQVWPVKNVELQGNLQYLTQQNIVEFIAQQPASGMLAIDLQALQAKAKKLDWIKQVEIRKVWPDTLVFNVDEHMPVALFGEDLLTQQGTIIKGVNKNKFKHLAQVELQQGNLGGQQDYKLIWQEYKQMKRQLELIELDLVSLDIDKLNNWKLFFSQGLGLNLGRKNRLQRIGRLVDVFEKIENKNQLKNIDLRYHNGLAIEWQEIELEKINKQKLKS